MRLLPASAPIAHLETLDRERLYVFVIGPGEGEAVAVALPGEGGWLLFDGCRSGDRGVGLVDVLERWRRGHEPIHFYALTHPHTDHARGLVELVEVYGADIRAVAVTPPWLTSSAPTSITSKRIVAAQVAMGLGALERLCRNGAAKIDLLAGVKLPVPQGVDVEVICPDADGASSGDPNDASAVVELTYGTSRLVLGSDLPVRAAKGGGWESLCRARPTLGDHTVLKIPHHGSATSHHAPLFPKHGGERAWSVTPFNSHPLPDVVRMDGLRWILDQGQPVHLTAPPVSKRVQVPVPHPGTVRLVELAERIVARPTGNPLLDAGAVDATPVAIRTRDSLWCFQVDATGRVDGRWRGDAALEVSS